MPSLGDTRETILEEYASSFRRKELIERSETSDALLEVFRLTPVTLNLNRQYWHRELGMCWERLVKHAFVGLPGYRGTLRGPEGSPCDFAIETTAIDTKYRLGSGDAGTLNKLVRNAEWLHSQGLIPLMLFLRTDSLPAATSRMRSAGWTLLAGAASFKFILERTGVDLESELRQFAKLACYQLSSAMS